VTGASGFVGGAVCRDLVARGHEVVAFGRRPAVDPAQVGRAEYRAWDLTRGPLPVRAPQVDAVVHSGAAVGDWGPWRGFVAVNVTGTLSVLRTFPEARLVHVSTASVYAPDGPKSMLTESAGPAPRLRDAYGATKAAAERLVSARRPDAVVLRPHAVYGPGDPTLLPRLLGARTLGVLPCPGTGRQLISLTSVANLVAAVRCGLESGASGLFNVADDSPVVLGDLLREVLERLGLPPRVLPVPAPAVDAVARVSEALYTAAGIRPAPRVTRYAVAQLAGEYTLDLTAARTRLGYRPAPTDLSFL
jgi:nucleoside-diphosphate-sugar epimerase